MFLECSYDAVVVDHLTDGSHIEATRCHVRRDEHLAGVLEEALPDYPRIVVPWGALHQRSLSARIESWGYRQTGEQRHLAISWRDVAEAVLP